jgi:hypothetical protein
MSGGDIDDDIKQEIKLAPGHCDELEHPRPDKYKGEFSCRNVYRCRVILYIQSTTSSCSAASDTTPHPVFCILPTPASMSMLQISYSHRSGILVHRESLQRRGESIRRS